MPIYTSTGEEFEDYNQFLVSEPSAKITVTPPAEIPMPEVTAGEEGISPRVEVPPQDLFKKQEEQHQKIEKTFTEKLSETWPAKAVESFVNALKLPGDVYSGKIDMNSQEGIDRAIELATSLGSTSFALSPFKPGLGLFGGRFSKQAVNWAESMEKQGFSESAIKEMTGLERGADSMWRKEFSDSKSIYNPTAWKTPPKDQRPPAMESKASLDQVLVHDDLYKIYPEARAIEVWKVNNLPAGTNGQYTPGTRLIELNSKIKDEDVRSTLLHEIQHWIQDKEGFALGMTEMLPPALRDQAKGYFIRKYGVEPLKNISDLLAKGDLEAARKAAKKLLNNTDYTIYRALSSETEAFNVERRRNMTAREIQHLLGKATEDFPRKDQIIAGFDEGMGSDFILFGSRHSKEGEYYAERKTN